MKHIYLILLIAGIPLLCAVSEMTAQSFSSLKRNDDAIFDATLNTLLLNNDKAGLSNYLQSKPDKVNAASSSISRQGFGSAPIVKTIPLLYDAVERTLNGKNTPDICGIILNANCDLNAAFDDKTPIYLILDFIATHPIEQCASAEQLLTLFAARPDFDVNYRYRSLLPPLAYLIRTNRQFLGKFDKNYISDHTLKLLIDKGSPINTYDNDGNSLMSFAIETNNQYLSAYFLENDIDLTKSNKSGNDAMFQAIAAHQLEIIKQLIKQGYELNIHNLKNEPASFKNHPETYNFLTEMFSNQVTSYEDIKLFIRKFNDKFSLVQNKLYAIYINEYPPVETSRNFFMSLNPTKENVQSIAQSIFTRKEFYNPANSFVMRHSDFDPDDKIRLAREIMDIYTMCEGLNQVIPKSYVSYPEGLLTALLYEITEKASINIDEKKASYQDNILKRGFEISEKLSQNNSFHCYDFFRESGTIIRSRHAVLVATWEKDRKTYNDHIAAYQAERAEYWAGMCAGCEIDFENSDNKMPESRHYDFFLDEMLFSYDDPGVYYMKNGEKYEFYQNPDFTWGVSVGWFSSKKFEKFSDMLKYFIEECVNYNCR